MGTFGIGSAAYWWSRLIGGPCRLVFYILGQRWFWQLLFADDFQWSAGGPEAPINLLSSILLLVVLGVPFTWTKFRGGTEVDWVGYWMDYAKFETGLSESRASWIKDWLERKLEDGAVPITEFREGLGRLGFAAGAVEFWRPFLGPLYAWVSVMPRPWPRATSC